MQNAKGSAGQDLVIQKLADAVGFQQAATDPAAVVIMPQQPPAASVHQPTSQAQQLTLAAAANAGVNAGRQNSSLNHNNKQNIKVANKRRDHRNRITWGSHHRAPRVTKNQPAAAPSAVQTLRAQGSEPGSSTDSGSLAARSEPLPRQQYNGAGDLVQLIGATAAGLHLPGTAGQPKLSKQIPKPAVPQQQAAATAGAPANGRAVVPVTVVQGNKVQHSDVLVKLGQLLLKLRQQREQANRDGSAAAAPASGLIGSKRPLTDGAAAGPAAKSLRLSQSSGPSSAAAGSHSPAPSLPPAGATAARATAVLPVLTVQPRTGPNNLTMPLALLQGPSHSPSPAAGNSSVQQGASAVAASSVAAAAGPAGKLPVLQLPLAMRVSYLRSAGFLPVDSSKPKRKQSEDDAGKPPAQRKRSRRTFKDSSEPIVGWDERAYAHGSDRQRIWDGHKMTLRMIQVALASEPEVAARIDQATVEFNARSCVCCWRTRPTSGSWFCSRVSCWEIHKREYSTDVATAASIRAADERHWADVKAIVQPVLKKREQQKVLQQPERRAVAAADAPAGDAASTAVAADEGDEELTVDPAEAAEGESHAALDQEMDDAEAAEDTAATAEEVDGAADAAEAGAAVGPAAEGDDQQLADAAPAGADESPAKSEPAAATTNAAAAAHVPAAASVDDCGAAKPDTAAGSPAASQAVPPAAVLTVPDEAAAHKDNAAGTGSLAVEPPEPAGAVKQESVDMGAEQQVTSGSSMPAALPQQQVQPQQEPAAAPANVGVGIDTEQQAVEPSENPAAVPITAGNASQPASVVAAGQSSVANSQLKPSSSQPLLAAPAASTPVDTTAAADAEGAAAPAAGTAVTAAAGSSTAGSAAARYKPPEEPIKDFVLPTKDYKYPDLKRLWAEHQLNMRVLLIELQDKPKALAKVQDAIVKMFHRPCLRCLSDAGHKCGHGGWLCPSCQRSWGNFHPITDEQAWKALASGQSIDPAYVARRKGLGVVQVQDVNAGLTQLQLKLADVRAQPTSFVVLAPAPAVAAAVPAAVAPVSAPAALVAQGSQ